MDFILFGAIRDNEKDGGLNLGEYSSGIETGKDRRIVPGHATGAYVYVVNE